MNEISLPRFLTSSLALVIILLLLLSASGCSSLQVTHQTIEHGKYAATATPTIPSSIITYRIESDAPAVDHIYAELKKRNGTDSLSEDNATAPFITELSFEHNMPFPFKSASVTAKASSEASFVSCQILNDGVMVAESIARGMSATVHCETERWLLGN